MQLSFRFSGIAAIARNELCRLVLQFPLGIRVQQDGGRNGVHVFHLNQHRELHVKELASAQWNSGEDF
jgi:hypothetical protein